MLIVLVLAPLEVGVPVPARGGDLSLEATGHPDDVIVGLVPGRRDAVHVVAEQRPIGSERIGAASLELCGQIGIAL